MFGSLGVRNLKCVHRDVYVFMLYTQIANIYMLQELLQKSHLLKCRRHKHPPNDEAQGPPRTLTHEFLLLLSGLMVQVSAKLG